MPGCWFGRLSRLAAAARGGSARLAAAADRAARQAVRRGCRDDPTDRLLLSGLTLSGQTIWPLLARLQLPDRTVRIDEAGIGAAEFALLEHELPADILRRVKLTHKALVAQHHGLRNHQRHRGEARAARAGPDGEAARALRRKPSRAPARSLTSIRPTLPSASG